MPKPYNYEKEENILKYLQKVRKANMYEIGNELGTTASGVKQYLEKLIKIGKIYDITIEENGRAKRYFSIDPFPRNNEIQIQKPIFIKNKNDIPIFIQNIIGYYQKIEDTFSIIKNNDEKNYQNAWKIILAVLADIYKISYNEDEINSKLTMDFTTFQKSIGELIEYFKNLVGDNE